MQFLLMRLAFAFALFIGAFGYEVNWACEHRLLREGVAVAACVTSGDVIFNDGYAYPVTYEYWTGTKRRKNKIWVPKDVYCKYTRGNPFLTVLYDAQRPESSIPYFQVKAVCFEALTIRP